MNRISFYVNNIHRCIFTNNLQGLKEDLPFSSYWEFNQLYICWTPMEHAKLNLKHAKIFNPTAIKLCQKIYHLVRDYTLLHSIYERKYYKVKKIFRNYKDGIDLAKEINFFGKKTALNELLELDQKENGCEIRIFFDPKNKLHKSL